MTAPLIGATTNRIGRKNSMVLGFSAILLATVAFGLVSEVKNK